MDIRAGQGPLMPTLPHPMGLGLPPTHGHQQLGAGQPHHLGLPYPPTGTNKIHFRAIFFGKIGDLFFFMNKKKCTKVITAHLQPIICNYESTECTTNSSLRAPDNPRPSRIQTPGHVPIPSGATIYRICTKYLQFVSHIAILHSLLPNRLQITVSLGAALQPREYLTKLRYLASAAVSSIQEPIAVPMVNHTLQAHLNGI